MKNRTYIIAELGINHNGSLEIAKRLIDIAVFAGCDAVKFQKRNPDISTPEHMKNTLRVTPWGEMTYLEYKKRIEFGMADYIEIDRYCKAKNIPWSASVWDLDSLEFLIPFSPPWIKIPSAKLTDWDLLEACASKDIPIILSVGMSTIEEVDRAYDILKNDGLTIMHCISCYPAPTNELNLKTIETLKKRYHCRVGYSGHEFGLTTTIAAIYLGAEVIERHITVERTMWGTDQMNSVEPHGVMKLVTGIRNLEAAYGTGEKRITECEQKKKEKLKP